MKEIERLAQEEVHKYFDERSILDTELRKRFWLQGVEFLRKKWLEKMDADLEKVRNRAVGDYIEEAMSDLKLFGEGENDANVDIGSGPNIDGGPSCLE